MSTALSDRQALINEIKVRRELKDREYAADCKLWAHDQVWTRDEDSGEKLKWPENKPYLDELLDIYEDPNERLLAFPKSRQLLVSWSLSLWMAWRARYRDYQMIFVQADKEDKAAFLVDKRCKFIEDNLQDEWVRREYGAIKTSSGFVGKLTYSSTDSIIWGVAQGTDQFRLYTPTIILMDESEFQDGAHEALNSVLPFTREGKHTKVVLVSTSNGPGGVLAGICKDVGFVRWS